MVARPALGLGTTDQLVPFHDSTNVLICTLSICSRKPTAVQAAGDTHDTPVSQLEPFTGGGWGEGATDQLVPFHDSTSVLTTSPLRSKEPTAVQAVADAHDTALRSPAMPGVGVGATDQLVPFHDSASVFCLPLRPTAVQAVTDRHDTPAKTPPELGLGTTDQTVPSHDSTSVPDPPLLPLWKPTAVQADADTHDTPSSWFAKDGPTLGLGTTDQVVPFHDSVSVLRTWRRFS